MSSNRLTTLPRRPTRRSVRVACQIVRERDFKLVARQMLDLSSHGMLVVPERPVLTGEKLYVAFQVPFARHFWFDAEAVVARVEHGRRDGDHHRALGLEFTWADTIAAYKLEQGLRWFAEARARMRPGERRA